MSSICLRLGDRLKSQGAYLITVESCTGGGVASAITDVAGSSDWFDRGLVTYSNKAKNSLAGVSLEMIEQLGAVSIEVAEAMATGALAASDLDSNASFSLSITGVAGPGGGTPGKPVGFVCFAWAESKQGQVAVLQSGSKQLAGDRSSVRLQSIQHSLETMLALV